MPSTIPSKFQLFLFLNKHFDPPTPPNRLCTCPFLIPSAGDLTGTWISPHYLPPQSGVQAQQPWALETPIVPERLSWAEARSASSLWDEVTILRSQLRSQAQVRHGILGEYVWGLGEMRIPGVGGAPYTIAHVVFFAWVGD